MTSLPDPKVYKVKLAVYPETAVGGFSSVDGTIQFYTRVNALLNQDQVVVDLGAGRGCAAEMDQSPYKLRLRTLKGKCRKVIGVDIDSAVLANPSVDEARVIGPDGVVPLKDHSVDLIVCDAVLEHVEDTEQFVFEAARILRPGGWFCARTPNKYGYVGLGANLIPNRWHVSLLRHLQPGRKAMDVFPTRYRLNTRAALRRAFPQTEWYHYVYSWNSDPGYFGSSPLAWFFMKSLFRVTPTELGAFWNIFLQKKTVVVADTTG